MTETNSLTTRDLVAASARAEETKASSVDAIEAAPATARAHPANDVDSKPTPLFVAAEADGYRTRWSAIQTGFVDEPQKAVEQADGLVAEVVKRLAEVFAEERGQLETAWERKEQVSTEDLRQAMRRYRSFFERQLTV
jgi:NADH dehydrogenase/NADH:ubiquinone oxidoreductase subunit G